MSSAPGAPPEAPAVTPPLDAEAFQSVLGATAPQMADLQAFLALLAEWNERINLVGPSAIGEFWPRHAYDSAQLLALTDAKIWADLGAGAGFPGLVLAILLKGVPGAKVYLVESLAKRCRFLEAATEALALPAEVRHGRAEDQKIKVEAVTARACAPMVRLLGYARPYLDRGATGYFLKGQDVVSELTEATRYWKFEADLSASLSHPQGRIVKVKGLSRVR